MFLNKRKANAQLFVLVVMAIVSVIVGSLLYTSRSEMQVTRLYEESGNLYDLAVSGVELTVALMDKEFIIAQDQLIKEASNLLLTTEYTTDLQMFETTFTRLIDQHIKERLSDQNIEFVIEDYNVSVEVSANTLTTPYVYTAISKVQRSNLDIVTTISATISLQCEIIEIIPFPTQNTYITRIGKGPAYVVKSLKQI